MKLQQPIEGNIERVAKDGSGEISRSEGPASPDGLRRASKPIRVYNTIPGEMIKGTLIKRTKDALRAKLDAVVEPSPDRVVPRCPYAGTCGGCKWQHVDYTRQCSFKLDLIRDAFSRSAISCPITAVEPSPEIFYYRNRMDFVFGREGELGLKLPDRWWSVLDLQTCFLLSPESAQIVNDVRDWAKATGLPFWNSKTHQGFFRYLVIREGKNTGERMVMLVTSNAHPVADSFSTTIGDRATSIVHGVSDRLTDLSFADEIRAIKGNPWIHETINGVSYKLTPNAFFQTNSIMAAKLQDRVVSYVLDHSTSVNHKTILDVYCGSGFFSLALAKRLPQTRIIGIELEAEAIACAKENAAENALSAEYFVSAAEKFDWSQENPDVVIVDPPRAGMHPDAIATLLKELPPKIVYVSCSVERFVKEWVGMDGHAGLNTAYRITQASALDLFPHTPHMECVFCLERI